MNLCRVTGGGPRSPMRLMGRGWGSTDRGERSEFKPGLRLRQQRRGPRGRGDKIPAVTRLPTANPLFERIGPDDRAEALGVLLTGRRRAGEAVARPFLEFARQHDLDLTHLWMARDGRRDAVAALIIPGVGRTAMLFISPLAAAGSVPLAGQLIRHAVSQLDFRRVNLVQALLEPGQDLARRAAVAGGLTHLAELAYMSCAGRSRNHTPAVDLDGRPLPAVHWSEADRPGFAHAILESYRDTLDCPGLRGLRQIDDIIAGHMATGRFDPQRWTLWHAPPSPPSASTLTSTPTPVVTETGDPPAPTPAAVLLLAASADGPGVELVYLGVGPEYRRRGLARQIMEVALHHAADLDRGDLHLAVDDRNRPAMRLYHRLGFCITARKTALITAVGPRESHEPNPD